MLILLLRPLLYKKIAAFCIDFFLFLIRFEHQNDYSHDSSFASTNKHPILATRYPTPLSFNKPTNQPNIQTITNHTSFNPTNTTTKRQPTEEEETEPTGTKNTDGIPSPTPWKASLPSNYVRVWHPIHPTPPPPPPQHQDRPTIITRPPPSFPPLLLPRTSPI